MLWTSRRKSQSRSDVNSPASASPSSNNNNANPHGNDDDDKHDKAKSPTLITHYHRRTSLGSSRLPFAPIDPAENSHPSMASPATPTAMTHNVYAPRRIISPEEQMRVLRQSPSPPPPHIHADNADESYEQRRRTGPSSSDTADANLIYTINSLDSFTFGASSTSSASGSLHVPPPLSPSRSVGPLEGITDDDDEEYEYGRNADLETPRQSVASANTVTNRDRDPRTAAAYYSPSRSDAASHHTFGTSSSSFSSPSRSRTTSSTTHTSMDELASHHPQRDVEFDSEEEEYSDEYDAIEVSSVRGDSDEGVFDALERQMYIDPITGRRPSLPMAIPGTSPDDRSSTRREREGSLATLRRPSRSLDDQNSVHTVRVAPEPISVPETGGEWRTVSARAAAKSTPSPTPLTFAASGSSGVPPASPSATGRRSSAASAAFSLTSGTGGPESFGFDLDWNTMGRGITGLDPSDIAVHSSSPAGRRPSQLSALMMRRPSTSSGSIMLDPDSFAAAVRGWGGADYEKQRKYWTFRKDAADGRGGSVPKSSKGPALAPVRSIASGKVGGGKNADDRFKLPPWRGMGMNSEEIWNSSLVGGFKVRRIELRPQKPQQRVTIDPFRGPFIVGPKPPHDGAYTNIHKHSKVVAFSIHRHYRPSRHSAATSFNTRGSVSSSTMSRTATAAEERSKPATAMVLLAPRHVQEAYTSTNTVKNLRSHGLLDEERKDRKEPRPSRPQSSSSRNQVASSSASTSSRDTSVPPASSASSSHTYPPRPSGDTTRDPNVTATPNFVGGNSRRRRRGSQSHDEEEDEEDLQRRSRTTHNEAFSTMDATSIDMIVMAQDARGEGSNGVLSRVLKRGPAHHLSLSHHHQQGSSPQVYQPPWMTLQSRNKQEERRRRHDVLSNSFEDVGLLPPKKSSGNSRGASKKHSNRGTVDIFAQVPADSLFMLLPLWPGPTDPVSERNRSRAPHEIATELRQYLLVAYNPTDERPPVETGRKKGPSSSHSSPTSSADSSNKPGCDILLTSFHISARLVSHQDLQGSNVRVPDEGLAVMGPWHDAWLSMPAVPSRDHGLLVIGTCAGRDAGVQFDPEGLVKMGLCIPVPPAMDEPDGEPVAELTPIGKAVLEMAWIGALAVTSFGPAAMS